MIYETIEKIIQNLKMIKSMLLSPILTRHTLKFFIYNDVDETKGPLSVAPGTHTTFKKKDTIG